jgi:hypothetical protein
MYYGVVVAIFTKTCSDFANKYITTPIEKISKTARKVFRYSCRSNCEVQT